MRLKQSESRQEHFMRISMTRSWSIPFNIKIAVQYKRKWENGLTAKNLLLEVKKTLRVSGYKKKAIKIRLGSIYSAVGEINLLHIPPFYIDCQGRLLENGKYEYRYFVPFTPEDLQNAKGKQLRLGNAKFKKAKNVEDFGEEIEKEKEKEQIIMQEIKQ